MKPIVFITLFLFFFSLNSSAQNTGSISVPNTGANTDQPPSVIYPSSPPLSNPSNSTVPGASGTYTTDPGQPSIFTPNSTPYIPPSPGIPSQPGSAPQTPQTPVPGTPPPPVAPVFTPQANSGKQ